MLDPNELTVEQWREAFRRLCVICEYPGQLQRPGSVGEDGVSWVADCAKFDPVPAAQAILNNGRVLAWNDGEERLLRWVFSSDA